MPGNLLLYMKRGRVCFGGATLRATQLEPAARIGTFSKLQRNPVYWNKKRSQRTESVVAGGGRVPSGKRNGRGEPPDNPNTGPFGGAEVERPPIT